MIAALAETQETPLTNLPQIKHVFSHVHDGNLITKTAEESYATGYTVVGVEHGTIERARELTTAKKTRHCFNEEAIIDHLAKSGQEFDILEVVSTGMLESDSGHSYLATVKNPEQLSRFLFVPKS